MHWPGECGSRGGVENPAAAPDEPFIGGGGGTPTRLYGAAMRRSRTRWGTAAVEKGPVWQRPCVVRTLCGQAPPPPPPPPRFGEVR